MVADSTQWRWREKGFPGIPKAIKSKWEWWGGSPCSLRSSISGSPGGKVRKRRHALVLWPMWIWARWMLGGEERRIVLYRIQRCTSSYSSSINKVLLDSMQHGCCYFIFSFLVWLTPEVALKTSVRSLDVVWDESATNLQGVKVLRWMNVRYSYTIILSLLFGLTCLVGWAFSRVNVHNTYWGGGWTGEGEGESLAYIL